MKTVLIAALLSLPLAVLAHAQGALFQKDSIVSADEYARRGPPPADPGPLLDALRWQVLDASNQQRALAGLPAFTADPVLDDAAARYSRKMRDFQFFDHVAPDGETLDDRLPANEMWRYEGLGENLWSGQGALDWRSEVISAEAAANWIESPSHRENLLDPAYSVAGVGSAMSGDQLYITMLYGTPARSPEIALLRQQFADAPADTGGFALKLEAALSNAINAERGQIGLAAQSVDPVLTDAARAHALTMLSGAGLSAQDLSGVSVLDRVFESDPGRTGRLAAGFWRGSGGLIWQADAVVAHVLESWRGGSNWRDALDPEFTAAGIGVATDGERVLVTVLFGETSGV